MVASPHLQKALGIIIMSTFTADRHGNIIENNSFQDRLLDRLYSSLPGRFLLRPLVSPCFSRLGGCVLNSSISRIVIPAFIRANQIDMTEYEDRVYRSYNDFFTRKIRPGARVIDQTPEHLISPCDSRLSVYPIGENCCVRIKHTHYTVGELLKSDSLSRRYQGGYLWVFRLCVDDYHRYIYVDHGTESERRFLPGVFHTVNPVANDAYPIYKENTREYSLLRSEHFGTILMMEVGALLVGKIENQSHIGSVKRGQEKGHFSFGGSTIILMTQRERVVPDEIILENSVKGIETRVRMGERIGRQR